MKYLLPTFLFLALPCSLKADHGDDQGFVPLFNGTDLSGWVEMGSPGFQVRDGVLKCTGRGNWPSWIRTAEQFENYVLRLEYRNLYGAESGVFLHAPLHGHISRVGFEVQICDNTGRPRKHSPGAIFGKIAPLKENALRHSKEDFNQLQITMDWPRLQVVLNGELVQDLNVEKHPSLRYHPRVGYIGLQPRGKPVLFRNVRIKSLPDKVRSQWKSLANGRNLDGWTVSEKCSARWAVDDGDIWGDKGHGYLISAAEYRNCEFQVYTKSSPLANGGIFFRWKDTRDRGFEIQIEDIPDSNDPTGSIYGRVRAETMPFQPGEWVLMQVFLREKNCAVRINGVTVAESEQIRRVRAGKISLQMHTGSGWIRWNNPMIRPLPIPPAGN